MNMLLADEVQVAIVRTLSGQDLEEMPLYDDEIVLVAHPDHAFASAGRATIAEVAREPIVLFDRGSSYYAMIHDLFRKASVIPNVAMELDSLEATKRMVEEGMGVALVPLVTVERELDSGLLVRVDISDVAPIKRPISLILRKNRKRSRTTQAFVGMMAEAYSRQPAAAVSR
jgi:DNA-binding transcriptional LysR family regulator